MPVYYQVSSDYDIYHDYDERVSQAVFLSRTRIVLIFLKKFCVYDLDSCNVIFASPKESYNFVCTQFKKYDDDHVVCLNHIMGTISLINIMTAAQTHLHGWVAVANELTPHSIIMFSKSKILVHRYENKRDDGNIHLEIILPKEPKIQHGFRLADKNFEKANQQNQFLLYDAYSETKKHNLSIINALKTEDITNLEIMLPHEGAVIAGARLHVEDQEKLVIAVNSIIQFGKTASIMIYNTRTTENTVLVSFETVITRIIHIDEGTVNIERATDNKKCPNTRIQYVSLSSGSVFAGPENPRYKVYTTEDAADVMEVADERRPGVAGVKVHLNVNKKNIYVHLLKKTLGHSESLITPVIELLF